MFHAKNTFIFMAIDIFEYIFKVDLSRGGFIAPRCIAQMESGNFIPGSFNIRDQVSFCYSLMINIVNDFTDRSVNGSAN